MSAKVEKMFSVRQVPWHYGIETDDTQVSVLQDYPQDWPSIRKLAGIDWEPVPETVYALSGMNGSEPAYEPVKGWQRITRSDTGATLGIRADSYTIINHGDMGELLEAVTKAGRGKGLSLRVETAGCLDGGKAVWVLVALDEPVQIKGDASVTLPFLGLTSRHDGTGGATLRATSVRVVCMNTFTASEMEGDRTGATYTFRHTRNWKDRIEEARKAVLASQDEIRQYVKIADSLMGIKISTRQEKLFVAEFIPMPPAGLATGVVIRHVEESRARLSDVLASVTVDGAGIRGTAYGLVQGAGEYLDHVRKARTWETRLRRSLIRPEPLKAKATALALEAAKA